MASCENSFRQSSRVSGGLATSLSRGKNRRRKKARETFIPSPYFAARGTCSKSKRVALQRKMLRPPISIIATRRAPYGVMIYKTDFKIGHQGGLLPFCNDKRVIEDYILSSQSASSYLMAFVCYNSQCHKWRSFTPF